MYTQCEHCKAIFRIDMREITVAKGQLRCGECLKVFKASKNLSTTMHEPFKAVEVEGLGSTENLSTDNIRTIRTLDDWQSTDTTILTDTSANKKPDTNASDKPGRQVIDIEKSTDSSITSNSRWLKLTAFALIVLLALQVLYNYRYKFLGENNYQADKIQMLNHNVFAHPIESGVLLISASIENTAEQDQPYPVLEVRLTNSQSELVALRRFTPSEYLDNYTQGKLIRKNQTSSLKLKIKDPGNQATRFQFDFL